MLGPAPSPTATTPTYDTVTLVSATPNMISHGRSYRILNIHDRAQMAISDETDRHMVAE